jgi:cardiolipin synthase
MQPLALSRRRGSAGGCPLSIPNIITLARILSVPLVVWAITSGEMMIAFILFLAAGVSDAVDGFLAKRFNMASEIGAYLDPLADKALIVSIYVALGVAEAIPRWLVILVVSRDIMIVGAVILTWVIGKPMAMKPLVVSKLNTAAQIFCACLVLASLGFKFNPGPAEPLAMGAVAILTLLSIGFYVAEWMRHISSGEAEH